MAENRLHIKGLDRLVDDLKNLTPELVTAASGIVQERAEAAARRASAAYPIGPTGNLKRGIRLEVRSASSGSASAVVRSTARHAYLYERGTAARRRGNGASTGTMPAGRVFVPIMIEERRVMRLALIELVERSGLTVKPA